jgi:hypothetical protein
VHLYGAILISKTTLQTPVELGQERQDGILVSAKIRDTLSRDPRDEHNCYQADLIVRHSNPLNTPHFAVAALQRQ